MTLFHRHNWNLIDKTIMKSNLPPPAKITQGYGQTMAEVMAPFKDYLVLTFKCECGKVRVERR